ncbi:hypothetical protein K435DRAFT_855761 [Dendrothele bispora CBS 962.96]|uniref:Integral membrane protein n=1 Tax=Dendrothele bispora (strain CBS 962.96) TaxID=1314807 RepID=A0A4S8MA90_DENBC|nr:hypothetical protein K435DRAFT_855761 [Dendrothele bispora CBS 962.96]
MPSSLFVPFLLAGMILTGSMNSLFSKFQDMQCTENCDDPDPTKRVLYEQPVWQTLQMFIGEMFCFLPVIYTWLRSRRLSTQIRLPSDSEQDLQPKVTSESLSGWKILLLWIPAACDLTGTTLMNVGLLYTPVSIYQMTRGSLVLFVGFLSVTFLRRRLWLYQWVSLLVVMSGVALVGFSGSLIKDSVKESAIVNYLAPSWSSLSDSDLPPPEPIDKPEATTVLVGVFFIIFAQIFTATQFVVEEKIMGRYSVAPLVAVGFEGLFGAITILLIVPILSIPSVVAKSPFFDLPRGWHQMIDTPAVLWSGLAIACSIALFNFFGLSVTRHVSATARSLADTCRTLSIWIISLGLGWEKLLWPISLLQILGFSLLFWFNDLVASPPCLPHPSRNPPVSAARDEETEVLISSPLDETAALPADLGQSGFDVVPDGQHAIVPTASPTAKRTD